METARLILIDTHVLVWALQGDARLGRDALMRMDVERLGDIMLLSDISIWEIALLDSRGRIELGAPVAVWLERALALPGLAVIGLEPAIAVEAMRLPGFHKDPADRLIVATARHLRCPLVTADQPILAYAAAGHLQAIDARH